MTELIVVFSSIWKAIIHALQKVVEQPWFLPIVSFLCGYFAERVLDSIIHKIKQVLVFFRAKRFKTSATDIIVTGIGVPFFDPSREIRIRDNQKKLYLAPPANAWELENVEDFHFSKEDISFAPLSLSGVSSEEFKKALESVRQEIFQKLVQQKNGIFFNGKKYGIVNFNSLSRTADNHENPILKYELYQTDYYTHVILETLMSRFSGRLPEITPNIANSPDFPVFRSSIGISLIVVVPSCNKIIMTKRSKNSTYSENKEWYYVSVTEAMSDTDYDNYLKAPSVTMCAKRGLLEELNITADLYDENTLKVYDAFYETHFHQDGLVLSIELKPEVELSDIHMEHAKDSILEVASIELLTNTRGSIQAFIKKNRSNMRAQTIFALESYAERL